MLDAFFSGFLQVFTLSTFSLLLLGILIGFIVGILPGIGGAASLALMLPFVFDMTPRDAFAFLLGTLAVTSTTGDITSILFGIPGESISAALILDGHPMAKQGQAGRALGAALMSSLVGAIIGAFVLAAIIPIVAPLVLTFKSPEFFALSLLGITFVASLSGESMLKGIVAAGVGLVLAMIGLDPQSGIPRYTFGMAQLWDGIGLVPVTVGLFAIPEIVDLWVKGTSIADKRVGKLGGVWQGVKDTFAHWGITLRCSLIGTFIGIIPGLGAAVSQWMAYAHAVQSSSDKRRFGAGDVRGVLGPGAANNSGLGGSLVPTVAFGIPGNVVMALLLGAFLIKGIVPGPAMLSKHLDLIFAFVWFIVISNIITVAVCFLFLEQLAKITYIRGSLLVPGLILLIFLGAYAEAKSTFDMGLVLIFGFIGLLMEYTEWPRPPLLLGLVLGALIERNFFISYEIHALGFLLRPVVVVILLTGCAVLLYGQFKGHRSRD